MKYRKKPVFIEAYQWNGNTKSFEEIYGLFGNPDSLSLQLSDDGLEIRIRTTDLELIGYKGDYIIKDSRDEFHCCQSDVFNIVYEGVYDND